MPQSSDVPPDSSRSHDVCANSSFCSVFGFIALLGISVFVLFLPPLASYQPYPSPAEWLFLAILFGAPVLLLSYFVSIRQDSLPFINAIEDCPANHLATAMLLVLVVLSFVFALGVIGMTLQVQTILWYFFQMLYLPAAPYVHVVAPIFNICLLVWCLLKSITSLLAPMNCNLYWLLAAATAVSVCLCRFFENGCCIPQ